MKRCILVDGETSSSPAGTLSISMSYILGKETTLRAVTPKGMHRFKLSGPGVNYVHGGASLQEIVLPLVRFKSTRELTQKKVEVTLTNTNRKITNNKYTLNFFQTEKVGDQVLPRNLKVSLWDLDQNVQLSDEKLVIADRESENTSEREIKVVMTLKSLSYDKNKTYYLKMEEDSTQYAIIPFTIAIAFANDFGF